MTAMDNARILNIWADPAGESHFREIDFPMQPMARAGGTLSAPIAVEELWFRDAPADQPPVFHVAPRRQLVVMLSGGSAEFTTSDGESRVVGPGDVLLVEDTFGKGHSTRTTDGKPRFGLFISLPSRA